MPADDVIVVGGEALFDLVVTADGLAGHPGGGPYNTARTVGRLEQPVCFLGCVSEDQFGSRLRSELAEDGVSMDAVVPTENPTTLALAEMHEGGSATYRFYTEGTSAPALTTDQALAVLPENVGVLHLGTLGLILEPMASALEAVAKAVDDQTLVMVDPNCRPAVLPDRGRFRQRLARTLLRSQVVKVSTEDLGWLEPDLTPTEAARSLLADGPTVALVTQGGDGALIVTADSETHVSAPSIQVVDTIGAGDAFSGGFLAWWRMRGLHRDDLQNTKAVEDATAFACLIAARTCERAGASPPRLVEVAAAAA